MHRGGGFTKDHLYLSGLRNIYKYAQAGKDLGVLLTGKVSEDYIPTIKKMQQLGLASQPKYVTDAFAANHNTNANFDFILRSLK